MKAVVAIRDSLRSGAAWRLWLVRWSLLFPTVVAVHAVLQALPFAIPASLRILITTGVGTWTLSMVLMPWVMTCRSNTRGN